MDAAAYDDLRGRLMSMVTRLGDDLSSRDADLVHEFVDAGEFGVALEWLADALAEAGIAVSDKDRDDILGVARSMDLVGRVDRVLVFCPRRAT